MRFQVLFLERFFPAFDDGDRGPRFAPVRAVLFDFLHDILALQNGAENHVLARQPLRLDRGHKELRPRLGSTFFGHREHVRTVEFGQLFHILLLVPSTVNRFAAGAVAVGEISTLQCEIGNDAMEFGVFVAERLARDFALALVAGGQRAEIVHRQRRVLAKQTENDLAGALAVDLDFEIDAVRDLR